MTSALLSEAFLQQLDRLRIVTRRPVRGVLRGLHRSSRRGTGMEFADFREYEPGDDIRHVDWRSYMRLDRLVVKLFVEETDLPLYFLVDASASMGFGTPSALDHARRLVAALASVALGNMDRVSLVALDDRGSKPLLGLRGPRQRDAAFSWLDALGAGGANGMRPALARFFAAPRPVGMILLVSDFLDEDMLTGALEILRALRHEVVLVHARAFGDGVAQMGEQILVDSETGEELTVRITPSLLRRHAEALERRAAEIREYARRQRWSCVAMDAGETVEQLVLRSLREQALVR